MAKFLPLSINQQINSMKSTWPKFVVRNVDRKRQVAHWIGEVQPQFTQYTIEVRHEMGHFPQVRVISPSLVRLPNNEEGTLPHVYPPSDDPTLCLFDPEANQWNRSMLIDQTIVPWAFDWLVCYELWLMSGRWTGGGRHFGDPPATSEMSQ